MKITVTGGAGFVGSHLIDALLKQGHSVDCIDNLTTGSIRNLETYQKNPKFNFHFQNLEKFNGLEALVASSDAVFHLAASVGVKNIVQNPVQCIENNVFATSKLISLAEKHRKRIITFSTSEVYGKSTKFPYNENDDIVLGPVNKLRWAYAASKLIDDYLARAYFMEYQTPITIVRLFNTIGQRQVGHYGMVVPRFFTAAMKSESLKIHGTGEQTRCFSDVRDIVGAILSVLENTKTYGELINLGSAQEISINNLAKEICKLTGSNSEIDYISYEAAYGENFEDMQRRVPDVSKLHRLTGYHFKYNLNDTLNWIHDEMKLKFVQQSRPLSQLNSSPLAASVDATGAPPVGPMDATL